jgi:hypothetical protein
MIKLEYPGRLGAVSGFAGALLVVGLAIWSTPWFVTQDGAAHLYNAYILLELQKGDSPLNQIYDTQWLPLPNLGSHMLLMLLLTVLPAWVADRAVITLTFAGVACAALWLRVRVAGWPGTLGAVPLSLLLALNWMWLLGFYNFLLGAGLFAVTLGTWWKWRDRLQWREATVLVLLLGLVYFCHLFSFGITALGLAVLTLVTPGPHWWRRGWWTAASILPLFPLVMLYRNLIPPDSGGLRATWKGLSSFWSVRDWLMRWQSIETLQLSGRKLLPFSSLTASWHILLSPTFLTACGICLLVVATGLVLRRNWASTGQVWFQTQRGWIVLTLLLLLGCAFSPDEFGARHGGYLRQRLLLFALITLLPLLRFDLKTHAARLGQGLLVGACVFQVLWVWDYAVSVNRMAGEFLLARQALESQALSGQFIGTILLPERRAPNAPKLYERAAEETRYSTRPLLHLDDLLGVGTGHVVWNNYQAAQYFFPVKYQDQAATELARSLDNLNKRSPPSSAEAAAHYFRRWLRLFECTHQRIGTLVIWGTAPELEAQLWQWYVPEPVYAAGRVRIFRHR